MLSRSKPIGGVNCLCRRVSAPTKQSTAYKRGASAFRAKKNVMDNPYPIGDSKHWQWILGFWNEPHVKT